MTKISIDDVTRLAQLSALDVTNEEAEQLRSQLEHILEYVAQLDDVDTEGLEPTYQVGGLENVMRPDTVIDYGVSHDELIQNAPDIENGHIKVRKVL